MELANFDVLATSILLVDDSGAIQYANGAAEELFGISLRQMHGTYACSLFCLDTALASRFHDAIHGKFGILRQDACLERFGQAAPISLTIVPLVEHSWTAVLEVRALEHQVLLDRNEHLGKDLNAQRESLRNLAHEVKNPLGGIRGAAQLLAAELGDSPLREYSDLIMAEADRLAALVDRLIAPQGAELHKAPFNIHEVCERVHTLVRAEFPVGIEFSRDYDASVPELLGDSAKLVQALLNIVLNAAQALSEADMEVPRSLVLRTRIGRGIALPSGPARMVVIVSVIDNGPGVPPGLHDKVFHPLVTGRASGTGLGLSLAQEFVHQHGGVLEFESRACHTEFRMILPLERV